MGIEACVAEECCAAIEYVYSLTARAGVKETANQVLQTQRIGVPAIMQ